MKKFEKKEYGFWKQVNPESFDYDQAYKENQSTNLQMSCLRLGWLSAFFSYEEMKKMCVVDIGSGNGEFVRFCEGRFKSIESYDVCGESITKEELYSKDWDMVVLSDVLEHFDDINDLFRLKWKYAFVSFPETPNVETQEELERWHHYKPDEHIWCLNLSGVCRWLSENNCSVIATSNFEDLIRTRKSYDLSNISTVLVRRD
jgi:hypothetical protein